MKDNETIIEISKYEEEWYGFADYCISCGGRFMGNEYDFKEHKEKPMIFCPFCGKKIIGHKDGKITTFVFEEVEDD